MINDQKSLTVTGILTYTPTDPPRPAGKYVLQKTWRGGGNVAGDKSGRQQVRRWVVGINPRSTPQQLHREKLRAAVAAWHAAPPEVRALAATKGSRVALPAYHYFISDFMRHNAWSAHTIWDAGLTSWDNFTTFFD